MVDSNDTFEIKISGPGINVERTVSQETALSVVGALMGGHQFRKGVPLSATKTKEPLNQGDRPAQTLREFLNESGAKTNKEKIAAIGQYTSAANERGTFTTEDIRSGFRTAHEPPPKNLSRDINSACAAGWIHQSEESGDFFVTNSGLQSLDAHFGRE